MNVQPKKLKKERILADVLSGKNIHTKKTQCSKGFFGDRNQIKVIQVYRNRNKEMGTSSLFTSCITISGRCEKQLVPSVCGHMRLDSEDGNLNRRSVLVSGVSLNVLGLACGGDGLAVVKQGLLAGRVPGLSEPDQQGWRTYRRPDEKSGGHGVGWSPIIPYEFSVPREWDEVPVSIADLGGTEIDLRFASPKQGRLSVVVAPVLRFADDLGENATIEKIGTPEKVISAFGPEVIGENVEGKVLNTSVAEHSGRTYYNFELEPPHVLITATAGGNRLYIFSVTGNGLQWKRHYKDLKRIAESFRVV